MIRKLNVFLLLVVAIQCKEKEKTEALKDSNIVDEYYGQKIEDTYRRLENLNDSVTISWLKDQKTETEKAFGHNPGIVKIQKSIEKKRNDNESIISKLKISQNDTYFYLKRLKNETTAKLYLRNGFFGSEELLYDPKSFKPSSEESYSINYIQPSWDSNMIVVSITKNDEEFSQLFVMDVKTKKIVSDTLPNALPNSLGGVEWLPNNEGFIYTYTPITDTKNKDYSFLAEAKIYYLNKKVDKLKTIFSKKNNPKINIKQEDFPIIYFTNPKNNYVLASIAGVSSYRDTYYEEIKNISQQKINWKKLYGKQEKIKQFFLYGNELYYRTAKGASNFKICKANLKKPNFENPTLLVPEQSYSVISDFEVTKDGIYYVKTKNGVEAKLFFRDHLTTKESEIKLPKPSGNINLSSHGIDFSELRITIEGWTSYKETYILNHETKQFESRDLASLTQYDFLKNVIVEEIEIPSHDGVMVPLSIIYKKGTELDGQNRMLINAYGAYKWSNSPFLYNYLLHWLEEGGIYATAHVRGGGEKGDDWHLGGRKVTKPNSWKDLIACTTYLIDHKYTNKDKTALWGASAGGITIGRAITERPDLYKAAAIRVGTLNMLRSEFGPNGQNNVKEFGTVKDSIEFQALLEMDAYHHLKKGIQYPAIYLTAGMNDSRVPAWQPAKFAAKLQEEGNSNNPVLLDIDFEGGHGFEASVNKQSTELSKIMTFLLWQTGHPDYQSK
ncbi:prolyl oligopeptidase family serine peptidase [Aquimarina sp. MMG015]|uniref:prolyl oligopeptidase family serine peptidase n=1 Tax=Aquimarina sp. MMG015 TaxID=2822689 RepID=UPI001B3A0BE7|nr:prolyl oligopeptidase family serine peptidase [Aquimarina sp. MMG015]MBQ4803331.1 prolyl oligopeptidase family serine peptidase [Aquimarina sp. MMG015]